jgi:hypothetical protein
MHMLLNSVIGCYFLQLTFEETPRLWCFLTSFVYGKRMRKELQSPFEIVGLCDALPNFLMNSNVSLN